jgi:hypothetical protein
VPAFTLAAYCLAMGTTVSRGRGSPRARRRPPKPVWRLRFRALRRRLGLSSVVLLVLFGLYVVVALAAELLVNGLLSARVAWVHAAALPALITWAALLFAFVCYLVTAVFVAGLREIWRAARRIIGGRWTTGVATGVASTSTDSDGDVHETWRVEFVDRNGGPHAVDFYPGLKAIAAGTVLRVRYEVSHPGNAFAVRRGIGPRLSHWLSSVVELGIWAFLGASVPAGLVVAGVLWVVRHR